MIAELQPFKVDGSSIPDNLSQNTAGLAYRRTPDIKDFDSYTVAPWDSIVWGKLDGDFVKVGLYYLPLYMNEEKVILELDVANHLRDADGAELLPFQVVGGKLRHQKEPGYCTSRQKMGLPFYTSADVERPDGYSQAVWDSVIYGTVQGDFIKVGKYFVPSVVNGITTIIPFHDAIDTKKTNDMSMAMSLLQDKLAQEQLELNRLSYLQEKLAQEQSDLSNLKEMISTQLSEQQEQLSSENKRMGKRLEDLGKRMTKYESIEDFGEEDESEAAHVETNIETPEVSEVSQQQATQQVTMDFDKQLEARFDKLTKDFNTRLALALETCALKTTLQDLERRLTALEGKLDNLADGQVLQDLAARLASSDRSVEQPKSSVTSSQEISQVQSEMRTLKAELMPRLQAFEEDLKAKSLPKAFEGTTQTELRDFKETMARELKETVALQVSAHEMHFNDRLDNLGMAISKIRSSLTKISEAGVAQKGLVIDPNWENPNFKDIAEMFWKNERVLQVAEASGPTPKALLEVQSKSLQTQPQQQPPSPTSKLSSMPTSTQSNSIGGLAAPMHVFQAPASSPRVIQQSSPQLMQQPSPRLMQPPSRSRSQTPTNSFGAVAQAQPYLTSAVSMAIQGRPLSRGSSPHPSSFRAASPAPFYLASQVQGVPSRAQTPDGRVTAPGGFRYVTRQQGS